MQSFPEKDISSLTHHSLVFHTLGWEADCTQWLAEFRIPENKSLNIDPAWVPGQFSSLYQSLHQPGVGELKAQPIWSHKSLVGLVPKGVFWHSWFSLTRIRVPKQNIFDCLSTRLRQFGQPGLPHSLRAAVGRQAPRSLRGKAEVLAGLMVLEGVGEEAGRLSSLVGEE